MRARLVVQGLHESALRLDEIGERARRLEPALRADATLTDLQHAERRRFARGGWRRLTPRWVQQKRRRGLDPRTLRATGELEHALENADASLGVRRTVFNAELRWGITAGRGLLYRAQILSKGTSRMPPRRMVVIDRPAVESIAQRVADFIAHGFDALAP